MLNRIAKLTACYVTVLLATFLMLEGVVRFTSLAPKLPIQWSGYVRDEYLPFKPRPFSVLSGRSETGEFDFQYRHNSLGLRDVEHCFAKTPGTFRILALGDSYTYGAGVPSEAAFLNRLEIMLNERKVDAKRVEIIKAGIPRFWPEPERIFLEYYGIRFDPDLIVAVFNPGDVIDTYFSINAMSVTDEGGYLVTRQANELGKLGVWFYIHSHVARIILSKYISYKISREYPVHWSEVFRQGGYHEKDWRKVEEEYDKIFRLGRHLHAPTVIVHVPMKPPWDDSSTYPALRLYRWCTRRGAYFIDILPAMQEHSIREPLYYKKDGHCNAAGNIVIAETLYSALMSKGMLRSRSVK
jgi:hypothetical protein